jgi:hypothetical protein
LLPAWFAVVVLQHFHSLVELFLREKIENFERRFLLEVQNFLPSARSPRPRAAQERPFARDDPQWNELPPQGENAANPCEIQGVRTKHIRT